jgi:FPC/CPF motif-containing protein YcgG
LLKNLHAADVEQGFGWNPGVSNDIKSPDFGYSVGGEAFFIPFMDAFSGTPAHQSEIPMVVFNSHLVFKIMKAIELKPGLTLMDQFTNRIRAREKWVHPNLGAHGELSEFDQYGLVDTNEESEMAEEEVKQKILGGCPFNH